MEVLSSHKWMTLAQIKELMRYDNLVNMDTRTVLACIPLCYMSQSDFEAFLPTEGCRDVALGESVKYKATACSCLPDIYQYINNYKMFDESEYRLVPLHALKDWNMVNHEYVCSKPYSFKVMFCDIEIEGREVQRWTQPLFEATGIATFGLLTCVEEGVRKFLVRATPEPGCFDRIELGPTIQREYISRINKNVIDEVFEQHMQRQEGVQFDALLSEEGGRFYCEQNRNLVIEIEKSEIEILPEGYFWVDYYTLNALTQVNNSLNIQLRNLLAVLEW